MTTRERAGSFLRWVLWGTLTGVLLTGCGPNGEALPVASSGTELYAATPQAGSLPPSSAPSVAPASSGTPGVGAAPEEDDTDLWFRIDQMDFVND